MGAGAWASALFLCVGRANGACGLSASLFCVGGFGAGVEGSFKLCFSSFAPRQIERARLRSVWRRLSDLLRKCAWNDVGGVSASGVSATLPSASCVGLKIFGRADLGRDSAMSESELSPLRSLLHRFKDGVSSAVTSRTSEHVQSV